MSVYSVSQVEKLTGIRSHTLRIWERRYQFLSPDRTATNIRSYSEDDLKKLLNISILTRNGYKLGKLDKMSEAEIRDSVIEILDAPVPRDEDEIQGLTLAMIQMDEEEFTKIFDKEIARLGVLKAITQLIYPFMAHVGSLWRTDRAAPANEHFVSNIIRRKLLTIINGLPVAPSDAKKLLLFLPEGENHEMGLLLADYIARDLGWRTYYLGQNVPSANIKTVLEQVSPDLMFSIMVIPRDLETDDTLRDAFLDAKIPWICSGHPEVVSAFSEKINYLNSPEQLIAYLERT